MASPARPACRRPAARAIPIAPHKVETISIDDVFAAAEMFADLEALALDGFVIPYVDEYGIVRYCPQQLKEFM